ncbi:restriction endonuclease subunit S [Coprobacillus sp. BIOML-A1]|nr:restriction endonuclease subunit S [Coprobacillus sp. BIOML-A1]
MKENKTKPDIRFKGFTEAWEQRKLKEITDSYSGGTPSAGKKEYYDGSIPFIRSGEISDDKTELFITEDGLNNSSAKIVHEGDILYALYGATSGEVSISKLKGAINQAILAIQPHDEYNRQFLMQWLRKSKDNIVGTYLQGGQGNLSGNIIKELIVNVPTYDEQNKIGEYFEQLDNLITLHQRECDQLKELKKSMLKKLFPRDGSNIPEVRFAGFTDAWEQRKVSELCSISTGKSNTQDKVEDGEYPFYVRSPIIEKSNKYLYDEEAVITVGDGVGTGKVFHYINGKYDLHQRCYRMYAFSNELDAHYFYHVFSKLFYKRVTAMTAKTSVDSVRLEMISDMQIPTPRIDEQIKIGSYLDSLDNLITLHQRELEILKNLKKTCLKRMFI